MVTPEFFSALFVSMARKSATKQLPTGKKPANRQAGRESRPKERAPSDPDDHTDDADHPKAKPDKDRLAKIPSIQQQFKEFVKRGPVQQLIQDVVEILKSERHNPHAGSLDPSRVRAILCGMPNKRHGEFFSRQDSMASFQGLLSGLSQVTIFRWKPEGCPHQQWRVRLSDLPLKECTARDQKAFADKLAQRAAWPPAVRDYLQSVGGEATLAAIRKELRRRRQRCPADLRLMMKLLRREEWCGEIVEGVAKKDLAVVRLRGASGGTEGGPARATAKGKKAKAKVAAAVAAAEEAPTEVSDKNKDPAKKKKRQQSRKEGIPTAAEVEPPKTKGQGKRR